MVHNLELFWFRDTTLNCQSKTFLHGSVPDLMIRSGILSVVSPGFQAKPALMRIYLIAGEFEKADSFNIRIINPGVQKSAFSLCYSI
jgi:hypothetical protein